MVNEHFNEHFTEVSLYAARESMRESRASVSRLLWRNAMTNRYRTVLLCLFILSLCGLAQSQKPTTQTSPTTSAPDKAYMQKIWDGWGTLDPANVANFY